MIGNGEPGFDPLAFRGSGRYHPSVLLVRRTQRVIGSEVERAYAGLQRPGLRVYVVGTRGFAFDTALLGSAMQSAHPSPQRGLVGQLTIPLLGQMELRGGGKSLAIRTGEIALDPPRGWNERWDPSGFQALVIEWTEEHGSPVPAIETSILGARDRARVSAFVQALTRGELRGAGAAQATSEVLAIFASTGVPLHPADPRALCAGQPPGAQRFADALGAALSGLDRAPAWVDLEGSMGLSERQLRRVMRAMGGWLAPYSEPSGWRRSLRRSRAIAAAGFLGAKGMTLERIARSLGYGSSRALLLALRQAGLPPPSVLRGT